MGLPLTVAFAEAGHDVVAVDLAPERVARINRGESYIEDITDERLQAVAARITADTAYEPLAGTDAVIVCVPTPLSENREPNLQPLRAAGWSLARVLRPGQLIVLESTTFPGTTRDLLAPILEKTSGLVAGVDYPLAFSPERVDPGRTDYTLRNTPKIVGGLTEACGDAAEALYTEVCDDIVRVSSPEVAELTKLHENIFRSVNIAMVNEMSMLCERMGIDIWEVVDAASTKPYGFMRFEPGPGMGGHCLPVDPFYLSWQARKFDMTTRFIELAGEVNQQMPYECTNRIVRALNDVGKPVRGSRIAILGVSYKAGIGDVRESPALKIIELLTGMGGDVVYSDPYVPTVRVGANPACTIESLVPEDAVEGCDVAVIVTAHPGVDHGALIDDGPVVDLRGVLRPVRVAS
ncbi:MAG: nucleotide sugar dehydrogenase [Solirubrobacteraceae bacterium]|nr:nucleotide sugar dehydrogenase [Solirubrobacteraceae bacterium]